MYRFCVFMVFACLSIVGCGGGEEVTPAPQTAAQDRLIPTRTGDDVSVTQAYGPLVVHEGQFEATAKVKPWSAWWLPIKDTYLFLSRDGRLSPLEKYDEYLKAAGHAASGVEGSSLSSAAYEKAELYDPMAGNWEGLCDAWAAASISEPEPVRSVFENGILFEVGDLKSLLIKTYEQTQGAERFGQRYNGDRLSVFDDIFPDQFHRFVQNQLFEKNRPFVMDKDPGVQVWNTPIWRVQFSVTKDSADPQLMHVHAWFWGATPFVPNYDYVGTLSVSFEYTYDLVGITQSDGGVKVLFGVWTGDSLDYHPDFVSTVSDRTMRKSKNPAIQVDVVNALVEKSRADYGQ